MAQLKTLTVSGTTYTVTDPEAVKQVEGHGPDETGNVRILDDSKAGPYCWSGKNIADKLCPSFTESGALVTCAPVEGYPLEAVSALTASEIPYASVSLIRKGKNICPYASSAGANSSGHINLYTDARIYSGMALTVSADITREDITLTENGVMRFYIYYTDDTRTTGSVSYGAEKDGQPHKKVITVMADAAKTISYMRLIPVANGVEGDRADNIQIEIGNTATDYEPYQSDTFTVNLEQPVYGGSLDWTAGVLTDEKGNTHQLIPQQVTALSGVNVLYSSTGDTAVTGRADPRAVIQNQQELINRILDRVAALEAAAVRNT